MSLMSLSHRQTKTIKKKKSVFSSFLFFIHSMENWTDKPLHGPHKTVIQIYSDALRQEKFLMETYSRVPTGGRAVWSSARLKADLITNYSFNKDNYYRASWNIWEPPPPPLFELASNKDRQYFSDSRACRQPDGHTHADISSLLIRTTVCDTFGVI